MVQQNEHSTNLNGQVLDYADTNNHPTARCNAYMTKHGINVQNVSKDRMKVMAQLVPTHTFDMDTGGTEQHKACTLPESALRTYNINPGAGYHCMLQNPDNVVLRFASGKGAVDVMKGCVASFSHDRKRYGDGDVYPGEGQVNNMLDDAYQILDYETIVIIRALRQKVKELTEKRDHLKNVVLPQSYSEMRQAYDNYLMVRADCDYYIDLYPSVMRKIASLLYTINIGIHRANQKVNWLKGTLKQHHRDAKINKLIRNIRELSFVTLFEHVMSGGSGGGDLRTFKKHILSGSPKISYTKPVHNLNHNNINNKSQWAGGSLDIGFVGGGWNDRVSSIFFAPGMNAEGYEHVNFVGRKITFTPYEYPNNLQSGYFPDFRQVAFNDILSSLRVFGAFNSQYWDDTADFHRRVDNPYTPAGGRPAMEGIPANTPPPPPRLQRGQTLGDAGGPGGGGFEFVCGDGSYVTQFNGRSGAWMDRIGGRCSNGQSFGPYGGAGGGPFEVNSGGGFSKLGVYANRRFVDNVQFFNGGNRLGAQGGGAGSSGGGAAVHNFDCGGGKIIGIRGASGAYVDRIGVICGR